MGKYLFEIISIKSECVLNVALNALKTQNKDIVPMSFVSFFCHIMNVKAKHVHLIENINFERSFLLSVYHFSCLFVCLFVCLFNISNLESVH